MNRNKDTTANKRREQLGIPYGTAMSKLRKIIMFDMAKELGLLVCYRCGEPINAVEEFSIDHKEAWLDKNPKLFWDLQNIAFSHSRCNSKASFKPHKVRAHNGNSICHRCGKELNKNEFDKKSSRWNGVDFECKKCKSKRVKGSRWYKHK